VRRSCAPLLLALLAASCHRPPAANPHYVLGAPYQAGGVWYYPRETYQAEQTGLAIVYPSGHPDLTTDGEVFDQSKLTAAHQTLQLPAIARVTNLENGRQILVRINDRGPATPQRLIEVTRRAATLLAIPYDGVARIRLEVLPAESQQAVDGISGAPRLRIATAPVGRVEQTNLPPPGSPVPANHAMTPVGSPEPAAAATKADLQLPETVTQTTPAPGSLYVELGTFHGFAYGDIQRARVARLGATIVSRFDGQVLTETVIIGPLTTVQQADTVLDQVIAAGVTDARIVVE
jgi:rare lipoprotein A